MDKVKKKVNLSIIKCNSYSVPNATEFQKKYPRYKEYNSAIYINDCRVLGPKDYDTQFIYDTSLSGLNGIKTIEILKALNIPEHIINQIEFED